MKRTMLTTEQIAGWLQSDRTYWGRAQDVLGWYPDEHETLGDEPMWPELIADLRELNRQYGLPPAVDRVLYGLLVHGDPGDLRSYWDDTATGRVWGTGVYVDEGKLAQVTWAATVYTPACERESQCKECPDDCQWEADSDEYHRLFRNVKLAYIEDGPADTPNLEDTAQLIEVDGNWYLRYATVSMEYGVVANMYYWLKLPFIPRSPSALEQVEMFFEFWKLASPALAGTATSVTVPESSGERASSPSVFRKHGEGWEISFKGRPSFFLTSIVGLAYLRYLLAQPYIEFAATHLVALVKKYGPGAPLELVMDPDEDEDDRSYHIGDLGLNQEQLDKQSRKAYRQRIGEIEKERLQAERSGDTKKVTELVEERKIIEGELYAAEGFGRKARHMPDPGGRARVAVTQAIGRAKAKIEKYDPLLKAYLDLTIETGHRFVYHPDPSQEIAWDT